ncbi:Psi-producing oxygenase A [Psilocybe cubensis]|uniref:Linoleate diol synthase n=2 Tax=Psilocybe cubensis TaxID=181762 RepID=A0A8H7Y1I1_PSICU|nr:Psi-producing oxygenase A [Psilocybe cubensis]KAH9481020.1 Psi-producing oxygenase A [Psilocybe cubensis]
MDSELSLRQVLDIGHLAGEPVPIAPTGYYNWEVSPDPANSFNGHSVVSNGLTLLESLKAKGFIKPEMSKVEAFTDCVLNPESIDDRQGAFAEGLAILARIDPKLELSQKLNNAVIGSLYDTFPHPPVSYLGPEHSFRQADGGGNNLQSPEIGKAGTPYVRSVQGKGGLPRTSLPDPGLVFDTLLKRREQKTHAGGMSSLIFAFATIVTHSLFRTDLKKIHINNASSYFDLSPLYGDNQTAQDKVRDKSRGRGLLYPDTFSEERLTFLVPATSVLLVLFSRNHNYIAEKLLKINEKKRWSDPPPTDPTLRAAQDEEIFQTAKLVNCGHFMSAILGDYVAGFLGSSEGCNWEMAPFDIIKGKSGEVERGKGNHISAEFNVLYRWHSTLSEADEKWTNDMFSDIFKGKPFDQLTLADLSVISKIFGSIEPNPAKRTFAGLQRGADGKFSDDDLSKILNTAIETPAGAFRARGTPPALRLVEIMGIEQARSWGLCTMNEFRKFLGLKVFEEFEDWNPDPKIAGAARQLYGHVDNLELYPGIHAEQTMPVASGSQLAAGYTLTRAVLGDALVLIRGDRFFTTDFTPNNLTTWGFHDCQRNMNNGGHGSEISKLMLRHLPRHYSWNASHSLYPFFTPAHMNKSLTRQELQQKYTFDRPQVLSCTKVLSTLTGIRNFFEEPTKFKAIYNDFGYGPISKFQEIARRGEGRSKTLQVMFPDRDSSMDYVRYYSKMLQLKISETAWSYDGVPGTYIDVVRSIIYPAVARVASDLWIGLPLKTKDCPKGIHTEMQVFDTLSLLFKFVNVMLLLTLPVNCVLFSVSFLAPDKPEIRFSLHDVSLSAGRGLAMFTRKSLTEASVAQNLPNFIARKAAAVASIVQPGSQKLAFPLASKLANTGREHSEIASNILDIAVSTSINQAYSAARMIDFYLDDDRKAAKEHIIELAKSDTEENNELLRGYVSEALRLRPPLDNFWGEVVVDTTIEQGNGLPPLNLSRGDRVRASLLNAQLNDNDVPNPIEVDPRRPSVLSNALNNKIFRGTYEYVQLSMVETLKVVFSLKNVRRAAGDAGRLRKFTETAYETQTDVYIQRNGTTDYLPGSLNLVYDA